MRIVLLIGLTLIPQLVLAAEPIGRLFFTVEQRVQLDNLRAQRIVASQVRDEPVPELIKFNGVVRRSDGKADVWINGQLMSESELKTKQSITGTIGRNGQVVLQSPQGETRMQLKVGQRAELLSGRVEESYAVVQQQPSVTQKPKPKPTAKAAAAPAAQSDAARKTPPEADSLPVRERPNDANAK